MPIYGYSADGYWKDVGNLEEYRQANLDILQAKVHVNIPGQELKGKGVWVDEGSRIDYAANFEGKVIVGKNCKIEAGCRILNSVIAPYATILSAAIFAIIVAFKRYVSLGSILAAASLPAFLYLFRPGLYTLALSVFISVIVIIKHRENIKRLVEGRENRL